MGERENMNGENFSTTMRNLLLAEPLTVKGIAALSKMGVQVSEDEYLDSAYVEPFTEYGHDRIEKIDHEADPDYPYEQDYASEVSINYKKAAKNNFEDHLKELSDSFFLIKGEAGSGKTSYVHKLGKQFREISTFYFCDFEQSKSSIPLLGAGFGFGDLFDSNTWKYISIILEFIGKILEKDTLGDEKHRDYISRATTVYFNSFHVLTGKHQRVDNKEIKNFFTLMKDYADGKFNYEKFSEKLHSALTEQFMSYEKNGKRVKAVSYITSVLIRLLFCLSRINGRKQVCVIDNVENFVPYDEDHPIQDCEISLIFDGVIKAVTETRARVTEMIRAQEDYQTFFGLVFVTRRASVSFVENHHNADFNPDNIVDISNWFCAEDIYNSKLNFYVDVIEVFRESEYMRAYLNIVGDNSICNWGLQNLLSRMYNHNYRRIADDLILAISCIPENYLIYFNEQWEKENKTNYQIHLYRKFIFRIMLDYIQRTGYLDNLLVEKVDADKRNDPLENMKSSYARKIATLLYRDSLGEMPRGMYEKTMSFPQVIEAVLKKPYFEEEITDRDIHDLASIMFLMNETRNVNTNWSPLIKITFDIECPYNETNLYKEMRKEWREYNQGRELPDQMPERRKYNVRITEAGAFFAKMVPDFEYFACRYAAQYPALMVLDNLRRTGKNGASFACLDLMEIVRKNAFRCIDEVIARDRDFFVSASYDGENQNFKPLYDRDGCYRWLYMENTGSKLIPHPVRIINHHSGYIGHYQKYVEQLPDEVFAEPSDRERIVEGINKNIRAYEQKLDEIRQGNPGYLK